MTTANDPIQIQGLNHYFGSGPLRRQILFDLDANIRPGEIVILTGPSGSGKTTALTLVGALRSAQEGRLEVLGSQLTGASKRELGRVRRRIGYIFQLHNLLEALTATQNVQMALQLHGGISARERRKRADAMLDAVGLGDRLQARPDELSGGQKQRVAIARALVTEPQLILADEPTASLDRRSGRDVVTLMQRLAREQGVTVVLVTHDNRILDIADRILHLEDGHLKPFNEAVLAGTSHLLRLFADFNRKGELRERVASLDVDEFAEVLEKVTGEAREFVRVSELASGEALESMIDSMLEAFTRKAGDVLAADRASLFLLDEARGELWSKAARDGGGVATEIRIPVGSGIAGAVFASGEAENIPDVYDDRRFNRQADQQTSYRTRSLLCIPIRGEQGRLFAVAQALNKNGGEPFDEADQRRFEEFMASLGLLLESWWRMTERNRNTQVG